MTLAGLAKAATGFAAAALLAVCITTKSPPPSPPAPSPVPPASTQGATEFMFRDAAGKPLEFPLRDIRTPRHPESIALHEVTRLEPAPKGESRLILLALDGPESLAVLSPPENYANKGFVKSDQIGLLDDNGSFRPLGTTAHIQSDGLPRQTYAGDVDDEWATWIETSSTDLYQSNWRVFAQRRDGSGSPQLLAAADEQRSALTPRLPLLQGDPRVRLSEGLAWWHTTYEQPDGTFRTRVLAAPVEGGEATPMLDLAAQPSPVTGGTVAIQLAEATATNHTGPEEVEDWTPQTGLTLIDASGTTRTLATFTENYDADWFIRHLASDGDIVALSINDGVLVLRTDGTPIAHLRVRTGTSERRVIDMGVCNGKVVFTPYVDLEGAESVVIYDANKDALKTIQPEHAYADVYCSTERVAWTQSPDGSLVTTIAEW
ncbi:MAG: hypothetical protein QM713_06850 [Arachnia sp.]